MIRTDEFKLLPDFVKSAEELKAKKICCKSGCMNCPYGYTVKTVGLLFKKPDYDELMTINKYLGTEIEQNYKDYELVILKGFLVGVVKVDKLFVQEMFLHPLISEKNITKELIESYYFY